MITLTTLFFSQFAFADFKQMYCSGDKGYIISVDEAKKELKRKTKNLIDGTYSEESVYDLESYADISEDDLAKMDNEVDGISSGETILYRSSIQQKLINVTATSAKTFNEDYLFSLNRWTNSYNLLGTSSACVRKVSCSQYSNDQTIMEAIYYTQMTFAKDEKICDSMFMSLQSASYEDILVSTSNKLEKAVKVIVNEYHNTNCRQRTMYIKPARFPGDTLNRITKQVCSDGF